MVELAVLDAVGYFVEVLVHHMVQHFLFHHHTDLLVGKLEHWDDVHGNDVHHRYDEVAAVGKWNKVKDCLNSHLVGSCQ